MIISGGVEKSGDPGGGSTSIAFVGDPGGCRPVGVGAGLWLVGTLPFASTEGAGFI
jgi:hypothetical protein